MKFEIKWVFYNDNSDAAKAAIKSSWRSSKPPKEFASQTEDILIDDEEVQTDFSCMTNAFSVENEAVQNKQVIYSSSRASSSLPSLCPVINYYSLYRLKQIVK